MAYTSEKNVGGTETHKERIRKDNEYEHLHENVEIKTAKLPLVNPSRGNYLINRTQSTEGVASKISLELKKKYLLGGDGVNNLVRKSESTSVLDIRFKSLVDQISEHQKLLNPCAEPSQTARIPSKESSAVKLYNLDALLINSINWRRSKELNNLEHFPHVCSQSNNLDDGSECSLDVAVAVAECNMAGSDLSLPESATTATTNTTIVERSMAAVVENSNSLVDSSVKKDEMRDPTIPTILQSSSTSSINIANKFSPEEDRYERSLHHRMTFPSEIQSHNAVQVPVEMLSVQLDKRERENSLSKIMAMPVVDHSTERDVQILRHVTRPAELFITEEVCKFNDKNNQGLVMNSDKSSSSTPSSLQGDDNTLAVFTETELSDWARDEDDAVSENFEDLILDTPNITYRRHQRPKKLAGKQPVTFTNDGDDMKNDYVHVCGKMDKLPLPPLKQQPSSLPSSSSFALANLDDMDIDFMDMVVEDGYNDNSEAFNSAIVKNSGYIEYVTSDDEARTPLVEAVNTVSYSSSNNCDQLLVSRAPTTNGSVATIDHCSTISQSRDINNGDDNDNGDSRLLTQSEEEQKLLPLSDDYDHFVHRLQERITPFNNVKDSIDVRKSRKNIKLSPSPPPPPLTVEKAPVVPLSPTTSSVLLRSERVIQGPGLKLEELEQERCKQKTLIHEMVMSKLRAEGKSIRDRKTRRSARNSLSPFTLNSSWHNSLSNQTNPKVEKDEVEEGMAVEEEATKLVVARKGEIKLVTNTKRNKENISEVGNEPVERRAGAAIIRSDQVRTSSTETDCVEKLSCRTPCNKYASGESSFSLPDLRKTSPKLSDKPLTSCIVAPSPAKLQVLESTESIRQQARTRARLMSDSELGLSPEDKLKLLKQKIAARKAVQSAYIDYPKMDHFLHEKISYSNRVLDALDNVIREGDSKRNSVSFPFSINYLCIQYILHAIEHSRSS